MKVELMEYTPGRESQRNSALTAIGLRLVALKQRFPSASQGLLSIFDQALVSGTSFVSAAIIGRTTAPDDLGLYYLVLSIVTIVSAIQDNAISAPYLVYCRQRQGRELDEYSGSVWVYYLILSLMTALTLLVVVPIVSLSSASSISPGCGRCCCTTVGFAPAGNSPLCFCQTSCQVGRRS
jgi:hypothetical protein